MSNGGLVKWLSGCKRSLPTEKPEFDSGTRIKVEGENQFHQVVAWPLAPPTHPTLPGHITHTNNKFNEQKNAFRHVAFMIMSTHLRA